MPSPARAHLRPRTPPRGRRRFVWFGALPLLACAERAPLDQDMQGGELRVTVWTGGGSAASPRYTVRVAGGAARELTAAGYAEFRDLPAGPHMVELGGVPGGCIVLDENPRPLHVMPLRVTEALFEVACAGVATLLAAGDVSDCVAGEAGAATHATARILEGHPAATVAAIGDLAGSGRTREFRDCYAPSWGRFRARTRPAVGNHEYSATPAVARGYLDYFGPLAGPTEEGYYSYPLGDWRVVVLNVNHPSQSPVAMEAGSEQERWLRAELAAHRGRCILAYYHSPRFSSGPNGDGFFGRDVWNALYEGGVSVVVTGHDHSYERFARQDAAGRPDPGRGIRLFVVGTGGAALRPFRPTPKANSEVRDDRTHGVLKLTLRADSYDWEFIPAGGSFTDTGRDHCVRAAG